MIGFTALGVWLIVLLIQAIIAAITCAMDEPPAFVLLTAWNILFILFVLLVLESGGTL